MQWQVKLPARVVTPEIRRASDKRLEEREKFEFKRRCFSSLFYGFNSDLTGNKCTRDDEWVSYTADTSKWPLNITGECCPGGSVPLVWEKRAFSGRRLIRLSLVRRQCTVSFHKPGVLCRLRHSLMSSNVFHNAADGHWMSRVWMAFEPRCSLSLCVCLKEVSFSLTVTSDTCHVGKLFKFKSAYVQFEYNT